MRSFETVLVVEENFVVLVFGIERCGFKYAYIRSC